MITFTIEMVSTTALTVDFDSYTAGSMTGSPIGLLLMLTYA